MWVEKSPVAYTEYIVCVNTYEAIMTYTYVSMQQNDKPNPLPTIYLYAFLYNMNIDTFKV